MKKFVEKDVAENPLYHDTWKLLKKYRDVVWSLEISVQHVRSKFEIEYGTSIEEFLDSIYLAGADLNGSDIEHHAKCIERSHKMLKLLDSAVECQTLRVKRVGRRCCRRHRRPYLRFIRKQGRQFCQQCHRIGCYREYHPDGNYDRG